MSEKNLQGETRNEDSTTRTEQDRRVTVHCKYETEATKGTWVKIRENLENSKWDASVRRLQVMYTKSHPKYRVIWVDSRKMYLRKNENFQHIYKRVDVQVWQWVLDENSCRKVSFTSLSVDYISCLMARCGNCIKMSKISSHNLS